MGNCGLISGAFSEQSAHTGGIDLSVKGDMHGYSSSNARIPIGDDDQILTADSAQALGLKWADASAGGAWTELYNNTLTSTATEIDSGTITATNFLRVFAFIKQASSPSDLMEFNGSSSADYSYAYSDTGASYTDAVNRDFAWRNVNDFTEQCFVATIFNKEDEEKTMISATAEINATGSGTASDIINMVSKWDITSGQITQITFKREAVDKGLFQVGTQLVILGRD